MTNTWDSPVYEAIRPYVKQGFVIEDKQTIYLLDNMLLTQFAKIARENPAGFAYFIQHFKKQAAVFLIPDIIFEESSRNRGMNEERYTYLYHSFFQVMSTHCEVFRISFEEVFYFVKRGAVQAGQALDQFRLLAREIVRTNSHLFQSVQDATTLPEIEAAIRLVLDDCGERILHLLACALLVDGAPTVILLSNEEAGVYYIWRTMAQNETLLGALFIKDSHVFRSAYQLHSFDRILDLIVKDNFTGDAHPFVEQVRTGSFKNRHVRFYLGEEVSDKQHLDTASFLQIVQDPRGRITF